MVAYYCVNFLLRLVAMTTLGIILQVTTKFAACFVTRSIQMESIIYNYRSSKLTDQQPMLTVTVFTVNQNFTRMHSLAYQNDMIFIDRDLAILYLHKSLAWPGWAKTWRRRSLWAHMERQRMEP